MRINLETHIIFISVRFILNILLGIFFFESFIIIGQNFVQKFSYLLFILKYLISLE